VRTTHEVFLFSIYARPVLVLIHTFQTITAKVVSQYHLSASVCAPPLRALPASNERCRQKPCHKRVAASHCRHPSCTPLLIVRFPSGFSQVLFFRVTLFAAFSPFSPPVRCCQHSHSFGRQKLLTFSSHITSSPLTKFIIEHKSSPHLPPRHRHPADDGSCRDHRQHPHQVPARIGAGRAERWHEYQLSAERRLGDGATGGKPIRHGANGPNLRSVWQSIRS